MKFQVLIYSAAFHFVSVFVARRSLLLHTSAVNQTGWADFGFSFDEVWVSGAV